jgi:hypothetical protein
MGVSEKCYFNIYLIGPIGKIIVIQWFFFSLSLSPSRHQSRLPEGSDEKRLLDLGAHYFTDKPIWCQHVLLPKGI